MCCVRQLRHLDRAERVGWDGTVTIDAATEVFEEHRPVLMGVAYRMLGRVSDAEDVVQEAWLRWSRADRDAVRAPRGYLVRVTTRLAVDRLRQAQARKESYVGPWLPEPYATDFGDAVPDTADRAVLTDSVSLAVLVVLESLSPLSVRCSCSGRPSATPFADIAATLDRSEAAVRQLAIRARRHVDERRPRYEVDPAERRDLTERFLAASVEGDLDGLLRLLAPDVSSGRGQRGAVPRHRCGFWRAHKVARFLAGVAAKGIEDVSFRFLELNGGTALLVLSGGKPDTVLQVEVVDGLIQCIYIMRNPDKLGSLSVG